MASSSKVLGLLHTFASLNKYEIQITGDLSIVENVMVKSVSLPEVSRQEAEYWKHGIKYIEQREIQFTNEISITFYQQEGDRDTNLRDKLIISLENGHNLGMIVTQYKKNVKEKSNTVVNYHGVFVKSIGSIEMSSSSTEIPEFTVTFSFNWMDYKNKLEESTIKG